ncbi:serine/threonine-protein kinase [Kitasatospora sp. NPDC097643]|uniref:serine/threonine-protein kinase n=1 Tax=Kitasatospora sp. NPDC097643 TaxID=3157230 RepID=UPI00333080D6
MSVDRTETAAPTAFQPLTADDPATVGGYRLFARLGAGGMGRVYLSYTRGGRPVALKVVRPELAEYPEFRERFAQEVASARLIHGLYTAQVVDAGVDDAVPWLATAYVPGPSLHEVVKHNGPLAEPTVLLLMAGIAEALQAIHAAGVVHRDLKPANVLLAADGPRVIDFGIARAAEAVTLTSTGLRVGSPGFMAPEQALGLPATPATDLFALGALAAHIAGGAPPFGGGSDSSALYRAIHEEPDLSRVPASLHGLIGWCLAKQAEDRPTTSQVIEAVHAHPALIGDLRFADGWLPAQVNAEIARRSDLPRAPSEAQTVLIPAPPLHDGATALAPVPTMLDPGGPAPGMPEPGAAAAPEPAPRAGRGPDRRGSLRRTALIAVVALALGIAGTLLLHRPDQGHPATTDLTAETATDQEDPPTSPTPSAAAPGYTAVYTGTTLVSADHTYEFDLTKGKVVPEETASWFISRTSNEFVLPDNNDAYVGPDNRLGPADCLKGLGGRPAPQLGFAALTGRAFCVRGDDGHDLAIVRLLSAAQGDGPVKVSIDRYRRNG